MFRALSVMALVAVAAAMAHAQTIPQGGLSVPVPTAVAPIVEINAAAASPAASPPPAPNLMVDPAFKASVEAVLAEKKAADEKKATDLLTQARQTGTVIPLQPVWDNGLWFRTPNKDWNIHFGGRLMFEGVWFAQPNSMKGPATSNAGVPGATATAANGVGVLDDGTYFRRVRLKANGTAYGNTEFDLEINFENINLITFDHMWVGMKDIPLLGTVRIGNIKVPQGLENWGTDYHQTFIERSALNDAFSTLFAPGILNTQAFLDQRMTYQAMFHRVQPLQYYNSADFGPANYAATGRVTGLPIYEHDGEQLVHVGASYQFRNADLGRTVPSGNNPATGSVFGDTQNVVRFRSRADIRDAVGAPGNFAGDPARFVDTGYFMADSVQTYGPELLAIDGPFALQTEATFTAVRNSKVLFPSPGQTVAGQSIGNPMFWGTYAEASYILTGEHRGYDKRMGTYDRIKVKNNAGSNLNGPCGWGAWQVAYRYSYLDLNDTGIQGGVLQQHTFGLNWYINDNAKLQFNYSNVFRDVSSPAYGGTVHAFGLLAQYYF